MIDERSISIRGGNQRVMHHFLFYPPLYQRSIPRHTSLLLTLSPPTVRFLLHSACTAPLQLDHHKSPTEMKWTMWKCKLTCMCAVAFSVLQTDNLQRQTRDTCIQWWDCTTGSPCGPLDEGGTRSSSHHQTNWKRLMKQFRWGMFLKLPKWQNGTMDKSQCGIWVSVFGSTLITTVELLILLNVTCTCIYM